MLKFSLLEKLVGLQRYKFKYFYCGEFSLLEKLVGLQQFNMETEYHVEFSLLEKLVGLQLRLLAQFSML